jgi:3-deoxy-D-arabino-heptulosonate 7-phosphate (DAHP) synthase class II
MPYVVRNTFSPEYDIRRNWSGWMAFQSDTAYGIASQLYEARQVEITRDLARACQVDWELVTDGYVADLDDLWDYSEIEDREQFEQTVLEAAGLDIRYHEVAQTWLWCHHEGLSCWRLEAETEADALAEIAARRREKSAFAWWHGDGDTTIGSVHHICQIDETLYLFWCEEVAVEEHV